MWQFLHLKFQCRRLEEGHRSVLGLLMKICKRDVKIQKDHKL